jgi:hypothetical protein
MLLWATTTVAFCGKAKGVRSESQDIKNENQSKDYNRHYHLSAPIHRTRPNSVGLNWQQFGVSAGRKQSIHPEQRMLVDSIESGQSPSLLRNQGKWGSLERPF